MAVSPRKGAALGPTYPVPRRWSGWAAPLAGVWSLAYGGLGLYWALAGTGFPFAGARTESWMSPIANVRVEIGGPVIAVLGLSGAFVALAMRRDWGHGLARRALLGFGWAVCLTLLLVIPDARILAFVGYLPALLLSLGFDAVAWPIVNQGICVVGGLAWGAATHRYLQRSRTDDRHGRDATALMASSGARRSGWWTTMLAVLLPLPYAATRLAWAFGYPLGIADPFEASLATDPAVRVNELSLGGMALGGALLTLGLIQRWGEVVPGWVPVLAGRRVPPALAVIPAAIASVVLTAGGIGVWRMVLSDGIAGPAAIPALVPGLTFTPWGIALGLATLAYCERRRTQDADLGSSPDEFGSVPSAQLQGSAGG